MASLLVKPLSSWG